MIIKPLKRKVWMAAFAVLVAVGGVWAKGLQDKPASLTVTAFYNNGANCLNTDQTDQDDCSTSNGGAPCTVQGGASDAYNTPGAVSCSNILRQP